MPKHSLPQNKVLRLEPVLMESCLPLLWPGPVIKMQGYDQLKHHQESWRYRGGALHMAGAVISKSWVGLNPISIISLKWVMMKVLLLLVDSLITTIKSQMHKSQDVTLIIFLKMVLRIIYAIKLYQFHKSKDSHTGWECGWEEEPTQLNSLDKKRY